MVWLAASIVTLTAWLGVLLTAATLPGIWIALVAALLAQWWQPGMFSWWTLGACVGLAVLGEVVEFAASAAGAAKAGGSRRAAGWSVVGALVGAIVGTPIFPIVGTVLGAAVGAGLAAALAERGVDGRSWGQSARVGGGAAAGRLVATVAKTGVAAAVAVVLSVAAFVR